MVNLNMGIESIESFSYIVQNNIYVHLFMGSVQMPPVIICLSDNECVLTVKMYAFWIRIHNENSISIFLSQEKNKQISSLTGTSMSGKKSQVWLVPYEIQQSTKKKIRLKFPKFEREKKQMQYAFESTTIKLMIAITKPKINSMNIEHGSDEK